MFFWHFNSKIIWLVTMKISSMFIYASKNNMWVFLFIISAKVGFSSFFLYVLKSWWDLYERWLTIHERTRPATVSFAVNSMECFLMLRLFIIETFFCNFSFSYSSLFSYVVFRFWSSSALWYLDFTRIPRSSVLISSADDILWNWSAKW